MVATGQVEELETLIAGQETLTANATGTDALESESVDLTVKLNVPEVVGGEHTRLSELAPAGNEHPGGTDPAVWE